MNASSRSKIVLPLASLRVTVFAFSAQAQGLAAPGRAAARKGPAAGRAGRPRPRPPGRSVHMPAVPRARGRVPGGLPGPGLASAAGPPARTSCMAARCRRAISAATPIAAISPGKAVAGIMRCTTAAWAGGGMSAASGTSTRSRWTVRPAYISEDYADDVAYGDGPAGRGLRAASARRAYPPPPPPPDPGASAVGGAIVGGVLGGLSDRTRQRSGGRRRDRRRDRRDCRRHGGVAPGYWMAEGNCYYRYPSRAVRAGRSALVLLS